MRSDAAPTPVSAEWLDMADEVLDLDSLDDEHIESLVGGDLDESVHEALRSALGPLYGNPGTVLETVARLREQGRIIAADNGFRLADPDSPIALPEGHDLLLHARRLGRLGPRLLAAVARLGEFDMEDLAMVADALGEDISECGRTVDRLVESSLLVSDSSGRLHCLCPALAVSAENQERAAIRRLPAPSFQKPSLFRGVGSVAPAAPAQSLSEAEARIVELISMGLTNRRIGAELGLSEKTVESQLTRLFARTGCRGRVELVTAGRLRGGVGVLRGRRAA
jgi:DNA-binding CsgD family transcriptional regulator